MQENSGQPTTQRSRFRFGRFVHYASEIFVAIGAVCGVVAFAWQLNVHWQTGEKRLIVRPYLVLTPSGGKEFQFASRVTNNGSAPVFISLVAVASSDPNFVKDPNRKFINMNMQDAHPIDAIPQGAYRVFESDLLPRATLDELVRKDADAVILDVQTQSGRSFTVRHFGDEMRRALLAPPQAQPIAIELAAPLKVRWRDDD